jgi:hypothetical protein
VFQSLAAQLQGTARASLRLEIFMDETVVSVADGEMRSGRPSAAESVVHQALREGVLSILDVT